MNKDSIALLTIGVAGLAIGKFIGHFNTKKLVKKLTIKECPRDALIGRAD